MEIGCCSLIAQTIGKWQTEMPSPPKRTRASCTIPQRFRAQCVCWMSEWSVYISEQMSEVHVPVQQLQRSSVISLSFPAVSASLYGRSVTLGLCFTPSYFGGPSATALLGRRFASRDFRLHKFSQRKAPGLIAVIVSYIFIEAGSGASWGAHTLTFMNCEHLKRWAIEASAGENGGCRT